VLLDEELRVRNTWLAGQLVVEQGRITAALERALAQPYRYPKAAQRRGLRACQGWREKRSSGRLAAGL